MWVRVVEGVCRCYGGRQGRKKKGKKEKERRGSALCVCVSNGGVQRLGEEEEEEEWRGKEAGVVHWIDPTTDYHLGHHHPNHYIPFSFIVR